MPGATARELFSSSVLTRDLARRPAEAPSGVAGLAASEFKWASAGQPTTMEIEKVDLWRPLFDRVASFEHASFYGIRGDFEDDVRRRFLMQAGFKALARTPQNTLWSIRGKASIGWQKETTGWRVASFETEDFEVTATKRTLFHDVSGTALDDPEGARRSVRDRGYIEWIKGVRAGELDLDETVKGVIDSLADGSYRMVESAISVVDLNRDGLDDFYFMPSDSEALFYRNRGDGTFEEIGESLGLRIAAAHNALFADFDNDGDADLFLSLYEQGTRYLENAGGMFIDRTGEIGVDLPGFVLSAGAVDADGDGLLDVYLARYNGNHLPVMMAAAEEAVARGDKPILPFPGLGMQESKDLYRRLLEDSDPVVDMPGPPNVLLMNAGKGRFERLENSPVEVAYQSMAASWCDYDGDGDMDLYVVNEAGPNQLIRNDGEREFTDVTKGDAEDVGYGMGVAWGDYDGDGRFDLYVTNMYSKAGIRITEKMGSNETLTRAARGNSLLRNDSAGFERVSGLEAPAILVEAADFGWGGSFADFDNDGYLDLYVPAGYETIPEEVAGTGDC